MEVSPAKRKSNSVSTLSSFSLERIPRYVVYSRHNTQDFEPFEDLYKIRDTIVFGLMTGSVIQYRESNVALKFEQLASEVMEECILISSPTQIAMHPSYQKIIGLGKQAIPLLIRKLDEIPAMWFWALEAISGYNPVLKEHRGDIELMVNDWKNWIESLNYE
jgi:hypothetical protein